MRSLSATLSLRCPECEEEFGVRVSLPVPRSAVVARVDAYQELVSRVDEATTEMQKHLRSVHGWDREDV